MLLQPTNRVLPSAEQVWTMHFTVATTFTLQSGFMAAVC